MAPRPPESDLVNEPAAPRAFGRLVMENGPDVVVDADCVIGRNPEVDPDVASGRAKPIVLPDEEQRISRVHARLVFGDNGVEILDAGSVNGTWIEPPNGDGWIAMVPRVPAPLPLGSRIQVGDLVLSYLPAVGEA
jgi:pSer/pThr/pTyr-binding forkhead associated (FHA) protein